MTNDPAKLRHVIAEMAVLIERNDEPDPQLYALFFQHPELAFQIIELINKLDEQVLQEGPPIYSACIFALDICVAQLQAATEANNKVVAKSLNQLMDNLAGFINGKHHGLNFWLPILNAFYEVHVDLTPSLKDAYFNLASQEDDLMDVDSQINHLDSIRDVIRELSDLSVFEIAENFFAQSYAMPVDFFSDLMADLYSIEEGQDIAILILLHPKAEVREIAIATFAQLIPQITLTSVSLSRLKIIKYWYPQTYHETFDYWIKTQRKKGVIFAPEPELSPLTIQATEVDGVGSQGIFIKINTKRKLRFCGVLLKYGIGLKDVWITPPITSSELIKYSRRAFDETVTIRAVNIEYFQTLIEHFLAITIERGEIPALNFLEIQELVGIRLRPNKMDVDYLLDQLSVQIIPFTEEVIQQSLKRSKSWLKNKAFTESWYLENPLVDKIVNHNSSFNQGVKVCRLQEAIDDVFVEVMELDRQKWMFHFLWVALWAKARTKKNEKLWQDSFLIAHVIQQGTPLNEIPIMYEICYLTVLHSVETMQERKTHLNKE